MTKTKRTTSTPDATDTAAESLPVHVVVLLDRSGSMAAIHTETVAGFNAFLAGQQISGPDARLTLVQFDSQDLGETLIDGLPIRKVRPLQGRHFQPRGATPLLDATAQLVARIKASSPKGKENMVVVTITDGLENASQEYTREQIRKLIAKQEKAGWTFVFLSAGLDAYDEAGSIGYADGSVQAWAPDGEGAALAFASLDGAIRKARRRSRAGQPIVSHDIFEGAKPAEADRRKKRGDER